MVQNSPVYVKIQLVFLFKGYICKNPKLYWLQTNHRGDEMQNIGKAGVDFIFCSIVAFLIIQGVSTTQPERNTMDLFRINSAQIGRENLN